jgi:hypothetical protein
VFGVRGAAHGTNPATRRLPVARWLSSAIDAHTRVLLQPSCCLQAFYKSARVEWVPVGVVGAIVPWNWPFHNIINPISAAVMSGNAIVIKVCAVLCCVPEWAGEGKGWGRLLLLIWVRTFYCGAVNKSRSPTCMSRCCAVAASGRAFVAGV